MIWEHSTLRPWFSPFWKATESEDIRQRTWNNLLYLSLSLLLYRLRQSNSFFCVFWRFMDFKEFGETKELQEITRDVASSRKALAG